MWRSFANSSFMFNYRVLITLFFVGEFISSCRTPQNLNYLQDKPDSSHIKTVMNYDNVIQAGDKLSIIVTALNAQSAQPYNLINPAPPTGNTIPLGYTVDTAGYINFPQLGKLAVAGLTRNQLIAQLTGQLQQYLKDPVVTVEFMNFRVTVLGEVSRPGVITVPDGRITVLEALGQSGDITIFGKKDKVQVIREVNGKRMFGTLNLQSYEAFKSPFFKLQQNDIVVVDASDKKLNANDQLESRNIAIITSVMAVVGTLGLLIVNIIR